MKWLLCCFVLILGTRCAAEQPQAGEQPSVPPPLQIPPPFQITDLCVVKSSTERETSSSLQEPASQNAQIQNRLLVEIQFLWTGPELGSQLDAAVRPAGQWHGRLFRTKSSSIRAWTRDGVELSNDDFNARLAKPLRAVLLRKPFDKSDSFQSVVKYFSPETVFLIPDQWIRSFRDTPAGTIKSPSLPPSSRAGTPVP